MDAEKVTADIEKLTGDVKTLQDACTISAQKNDVDGLSLNLMKLARVNSGLTRNAKAAMYVARISEHAYKKAREEYKVESVNSGKSATFADTQRYIKSTDEHKVWARALLFAEQADDLGYRTDTFLRIAQSRLSLMVKDSRG